MRGILIDPETKTIKEVDYNGNYKHINELIGADLFTVVTIHHHDLESSEAIYVDDEGLLNEPKHFFKWKGYDQPLAGRGLILGTDNEGESVATSLTLSYVIENVEFPELEFVGFDPIQEREEEHYGKKFWMIGSRAIFRDKS